MEKSALDIRKEKILAFMSDEQYRPMKHKEFAAVIGVPPNERDNFNEIINSLSNEGKIIITNKGKLMLPESLGLITGVFHRNARGFGFVSTGKAGEEDIFIPPQYINSAMNKDEVICRINIKNNGGKRSEGEIVRVTKRGYKEVIGQYIKQKGFGYVMPDDKKIIGHIYVEPKNSRGAVTGHKVAVKITKPAISDLYAEGSVIEILGHKNDPGVDILSIIRQADIPTQFKKSTFAELENIPEEVCESDIAERMDLRGEVLVTIDGEDTKDIDDAVSLIILPNGNYRLGVHIADVSHYVTEGSELNREAYNRGRSVYLVDRVIPMLPHKLSNGICSLNPDVDRLALSCIMEIDAKGVVLKHEIRNTVIHVARQMTYTKVNDLLVDENSVFADEYEEFIPMFRNMEILAGILRDKRIQRGAIEFDFPESKIIVDDLGKPTDIKPYMRNIATSIIEEFMLVCNETIAEEFFWMEAPFVYRTHEEPDPEKILKLSEFIANLGYSIKKHAMHPRSIQQLLSKVESTPEEAIISRVVLRSFKQARYTPENLGHFGLASKYYCHFTSPIRRYPDLQIHRIIKENLAGKLNKERIEVLNEMMPEVCKQCSVMERKAETVEMEVENLKKVEFMSDKIGEYFDGIVSGITSWGIFIALPNTVEGMASFNSLTDDRYFFNQEQMRYEGHYTGRTIKLGDKVFVKLIRANVDERTLDFELINQEPETRDE